MLATLNRADDLRSADDPPDAGWGAATRCSGTLTSPSKEAVVGWIVFLVVAVPLVGVVAWLALDESIVHVEPGQLGLLLVHGKATDRVLDPGVHWVPALRRRTMQVYPSLELAYRATATGREPHTEGLEQAGPAPKVTLGDRTTASVGYTLRFRIDVAMLRRVHERFGPSGIWAAVRDQCERTLRESLADPGVGVDDLFRDARGALEARLGEHVTAALAADGVVVTMFHLGDIDLGRTGEVIEATARARHELDRERAEEEMRRVRAQIDAELGPYVSEDAALRYREVDSWREVVRETGMWMPAPTRTSGTDAQGASQPPAPGEGA
jgi:regulator of protease activity HflC (stomatin/prohibitin superfamily)